MVHKYLRTVKHSPIQTQIPSRALESLDILRMDDMMFCIERSPVVESDKHILVSEATKVDLVNYTNDSRR